MNNIGKNSGITLIALIITIIVLLILAGVALSTLSGNASIIDNANLAVERYSSSGGNDQEVINKVENMFAKYLGESSNTGDDDEQPEITKSTPSVTNPSTTTYTYDATAKNVSVSVTGPSNYTVYYSLNQLTESNYTNGNSNSISIGPAAGTYTVYYYVKSNDSSYSDSNGNFTIVIDRLALTITANSGEKKYDGTPLNVEGYYYTDLANGDYIDSVTETGGTQTDVGTGSHEVSDAVIKNINGVNVTSSYDITYEEGTVIITKRPITLTD